MKKQTGMIERPSNEIKAIGDRLEHFRDHKTGVILDDDSQQLIQGALDNLAQLEADLHSAGL